MRIPGVDGRVGESWLTLFMTVAFCALCSIGTAVLLVAALHDLAFRTIPNWIPGLLFIVGSSMRVRDQTLVLGLLAAFCVFVAAVLCWRRAWLGGGDVKLIAACTMLVPPALVVTLLLDVALAGGVLAILYLGLARTLVPVSVTPRPHDLLRRIIRVERYRICRHGPLPYASAIAAGAMIVLLKG